MTVMLYMDGAICATLELGYWTPVPVIVWQMKVFRQTSHSELGWRYDECAAYWAPH